MKYKKKVFGDTLLLREHGKVIHLLVGVIHPPLTRIFRYSVMRTYKMERKRFKKKKKINSIRGK